MNVGLLCCCSAFLLARRLVSLQVWALSTAGASISTTLFTNIAYVIQICQSHGNKRPFVSTANGALVGTLMTMGDVNDIFPIPLYSNGNVTTTPFNFVGI